MKRSGSVVTRRCGNDPMRFVWSGLESLRCCRPPTFPWLAVSGGAPEEAYPFKPSNEFIPSGCIMATFEFRLSNHGEAL
jgi:hypothetical protein